MLQYQTISPNTLRLLKFLMETPEFEPFNLVGGTSLALQIGHRLSVDLDMFGNYSFEKEEILEALNPISGVQMLGVI